MQEGEQGVLGAVGAPHPQVRCTPPPPPPGGAPTLASPTPAPSAGGPPVRDSQPIVSTPTTSNLCSLSRYRQSLKVVFDMSQSE